MSDISRRDFMAEAAASLALALGLQGASPDKNELEKNMTGRVLPEQPNTSKCHATGFLTTYVYDTDYDLTDRKRPYWVTYTYASEPMHGITPKV